MSDSSGDLMAATALSGANADFIETLYQQFLTDPKSVDPGWARYFAGPKTNGGLESARRAEARPAEARPAAADTGAASAKQAAVSRLIQVFANRGHLVAD